MSDINVGAISEALNDKMDRDLQNVDTVSGADAVVEYQLPTADNGYTWYRKYASGWVEQGGLIADTTGGGGTVPLIVEMADPYYSLFIQTYNSGTQSVIYTNRTVTSFTYSGNVGKDSWEVKGMAA